MFFRGFGDMNALFLGRNEAHRPPGELLLKHLRLKQITRLTMSYNEHIVCKSYT